jgi:hypothetical protein
VSTPAPQGTAAADAASQAQNAKPFPVGTPIAVELSKPLDAKKAKTGDKIEAKVPADVLSHGQIVIPRTAKIYGHVTDVKTHSKESPESRVGLTFERLVMKDGREVPLQVVVQAISRPLQQAFASDTHMNEGAGTPSGTPSTAGGAGTGGSMPRSTERVSAVPIDRGSDASPPPQTVAPLGPTSKGVVGMKGLELQASGQSSVITSQTDNVRLDGGTQMILRVE